METSEFRPIYYLGCKSAFTSAIADALDYVDPSRGPLLDLFAGTGVVASALARVRDVTTVDIQEYSRVLCSATLRPTRFAPIDIKEVLSAISRDDVANHSFTCAAELIRYEADCIARAGRDDVEPIAALLEAGPLEAHLRSGRSHSKLAALKSEAVEALKHRGLWEEPGTTMLRHFGGVYFSFAQSIALDAILNVADSANVGNDTLKAAALSTASTLVNTVGKQFAQPLRPRNKAGVIKRSLAKIVQRDRLLEPLTIFESWLHKYSKLGPQRNEAVAAKADYLEGVEKFGKKTSVVYADPPYTRDHYSRFYHVLETMCLRDNPKVSRVMKGGVLQTSRGLYREDRHQSLFCVRSEAPNAFNNLFKATRERDLPLVLSYSPHEAGDGTHPRVVSIAKVLDLARTHYKKVEVETVSDIVHNKLNHSDLKLRTRDHAEVLIKCFRGS